MTRSLIFSDARSIWLWYVKIGYDLEKNLFKTLAVSLSLLIILLPSTIVIVSFKIILFDNNGLNSFQKILLSLTLFSFKLLKYSILLFHKSVARKFLWLMYLPLFSSVLFLRKILLSFVVRIIALDKFLFMKGEWLPLAYFFLRGPYWSRILLQDIKPSSTSLSQLFTKFCGEIFCNDSLKTSLLKLLWLR